jgi:hypothetical protein
MDRKRLLQEIIDSRFDGSQAAFARAIKRSPSQVHQWLTGHRMLGDAGARHIELSLRLEPGYFGDGSSTTFVVVNDGHGSPATLSLTPRQRVMLGLMEGMAEAEQDKVIRELQEAQQRAEESALTLTPERLEAILHQKRQAA